MELEIKERGLLLLFVLQPLLGLLQQYVLGLTAGDIPSIDLLLLLLDNLHWWVSDLINHDRARVERNGDELPVASKLNAVWEVGDVCLRLDVLNVCSKFDKELVLEFVFDVTVPINVNCLLSFPEHGDRRQIIIPVPRRS